MRRQQFLNQIRQETGVEVIDAWFGFHHMFISVKQNGHATMPYHGINPRTKTLFSKANMEAFIELIKSDVDDSTNATGITAPSGALF